MKITWPWEKRASGGTNSSYTDALIRTIVAQAGSTVANPSATGALEMSSGVVSRAFMAAEVNGPPAVMMALSPGTLGMIGRELIRRGEYVALVEVKNGVPVIYPSAYLTVNGPPDPSLWTYELTLAGPDRQHSLYNVPAERVIHIRYSQDPERPWRGIGPTQAAALAGRLSAETLEALADEASGPRGSFLPTPQTDGADETQELLRGDVRKARGKMLFVESMSGDWEGGTGTKPPQDWKQNRFGADIPESLVDLNSVVTREILGCCGVSPVLFDPKSSAAAREAWRTLLFGTIAPLGKIVSAELSAKLFPLSLEWQELRASDLQGRARSVKSLVDAGVEKDRALAMAGLSE